MNQFYPFDGFSKIKYSEQSWGILINNPFQNCSAICSTVIFKNLIEDEERGVGIHLLEHNIVNYLTSNHHKRNNIENLGGLINGKVTNFHLQFFVQSTSDNIFKIKSLLDRIIINNRETDIYSLADFDKISLEYANLPISKKLEFEFLNQSMFPKKCSVNIYSEVFLENLFDNYIKSGSNYSVLTTPSSFVMPHESQRISLKLNKAKYEFKDFTKIRTSSNHQRNILFGLKIPVLSMKDEVCIDVLSIIINKIVEDANEKLRCYVKQLNDDLILFVIYSCQKSVSDMCKSIIETISKNKISSIEFDLAINSLTYSFWEVASNSMNFTVLFSQGYYRWEYINWLDDYLMQLKELRATDLYALVNRIESDSISSLIMEINFDDTTTDFSNFKNLLKNSIAQLVKN